MDEHDLKVQKFLSSLSGEKILINKGVESFFLTKRESECLGFLARGYSSKEIGKRLGISPRTVESYLESIKNKLCCNSHSQILDLVLSNSWNQGLILNLWNKNA